MTTEEIAGLTNEDRLRLHAHDPSTFAFSYEDVDGLVIEIDALRAELLALREAVKPFAALADRMDANAVEYLRQHQAEAAASMTDAELAAMEFPDAHAIVSSGDMRNPTLVTMGDFRRARALSHPEPMK